MATFVAISGPSSTGKTQIIESIERRLGRNSTIETGPDLFNTVWSNLVLGKIFHSYDEVWRDPEYLCLYIVQLMKFYKKLLEEYKDKDCVVILDCCWIDLLVYGMLNMWVTRPIRELQERMLCEINDLRDSVDRVYMTTFDESKHVVRKNHSEFDYYSIKSSRPLELSYYDIFRNFNNVQTLPTTEVDEITEYILGDIETLGQVVQ